MDTSPSLLERLRRPTDEDAWQRFVALYGPLLYHWAGRMGLQAQDAADLVQDVFTRLVAKLPEFHYDPGKSFRGWLHAVLMNLWRDRARSATAHDAWQDVPQLDPLTDWDQIEYRRHLLTQALPLIEPEFPPATWNAFVGYALEGQPAQAVAQKLHTTVNAVYVAKSRVVRRLRQELAGLID